MKRPPGLWFLLSAGVLCLSLQLAYGIRATSLIFAKTTTTTSTTEGNVETSSSDESVTEAPTETSNVTKPTLTGNPQLDYIWDPNLPQELNGHNLSDYPFYERVPEKIDFKCDGLHDGFYASILHKCQVYHHCLFGTRYDFLCANYTAFDQKTFICHFASEVDCANSKKYWHRNDALYQTPTTTTIKPNYALYTFPPRTANSPLSPSLEANNGEGGAAPAHVIPRRPPTGPGGGRKRPLRRRRPSDYYDYEEEYEDDYYYEDRPRLRRKRPRPRPRPVYDDDYEEYEDDRYEKRGGERRDRDRRPSDSSMRRRNKDRRKHEDSDEDYEDVRRPSERRSHKRRPIDDHPEDEGDRKRSRPKNRRPAIEDDYVEDDKRKSEPPTETPVKVTSGSIYDRAKGISRIKQPTPKRESSKASTTSKSTIEDEEYYDDYEEPPKKTKPNRKPEGSESRYGTTRRDEERDTSRKQLSTSASRLRPQRGEVFEDDQEDTHRKSAVKERPKFRGHRERTRPTPVPKKTTTTTTEEYYDDYEEEYTTEKEKETDRRGPSKFRPKLVSTTTTSTTTTKPTTTTQATTTTTTLKPPPTNTVKEISRDPIVRIVKRPFLPSRRGDPFSSRGLQPVGLKAIEKPEKIEDDQHQAIETNEKPFKPSPVMVKLPIRQKFVEISESDQEDFKPVSNRPQTPIMRPNLEPKVYTGPRTTQRPKVEEPTDPLDIDEYDVTLNDALNPTLPNLPVRGYTAAFNPSPDYTYSAFQRTRYVPDPIANPSNQDYTYQQLPARPHYDSTVAKTYSNNNNAATDHFVNTDNKYRGEYSAISGQNYRPRGTQTYYIQQK